MKSPKGKSSSKGRQSSAGLSVFSAWPSEMKWGLLIILGLCLFAYYPIFSHDFTNWDDPIYVTQNDLIRTGSFQDFWVTPVASNYHPLTMLSLALNYRISGDAPFGYFLTNLLLHLVNTLLLAWILMQLVPGRQYLNLVVTGLFALHPLHVESVAWISERKDVLYVAFLFLAWIAWIRWEESRSPGTLAIVLLFFIASCLSKGMAVVFPGIILIAAWMRNRPVQRSFLIGWVPVVFISLIFGVVAIRTQTEAGALSIDSVQLSFLDRIITAIHGYVFYLVKMFLPLQLSTYYPYPVNFNVEWPIAYKIAPLVLGVLLALLGLKFRQNRMIVGAALWYLGILLPVSQIISVGNAMAADRYFYLSCIGPFFILGYWVQSRMEKPAARSIGMVLLCLLGIVVAFYARQRVQVWKNSITLFTDVIEHYPASAVAYHGLGEAYNSKGMYQEALSQFELALKYRPGYPDVLYNIAVVYDKLNQSDKSIPFYYDALKNKPGYVEAMYNLANAYYTIRKFDSSLFWFESALVKKPDHVGALNNMANIYFDLQDFDKALEILKRTLEVNPNQEEALYNIGSIYFQRGEAAEAAGWFEKCIQLNGALPDNYRMAGLAWVNAGNLDKGIPYLQKAAGMGDEIARNWLAGQGL